MYISKAMLSFAFKKKALSILQFFFIGKKKHLSLKLNQERKKLGIYDKLYYFNMDVVSSHLICFLIFALLKTYIPYFETFGSSKQVQLLDLGVFWIRKRHKFQVKQNKYFKQQQSNEKQQIALYGICN